MTSLLGATNGRYAVGCHSSRYHICVYLVNLYKPHVRERVPSFLLYR